MGGSGFRAFRGVGYRSKISELGLKKNLLVVMYTCKAGDSRAVAYCTVSKRCVADSGANGKSRAGVMAKNR